MNNFIYFILLTLVRINLSSPLGELRFAQATWAAGRGASQRAVDGLCAEQTVVIERSWRTDAS
jgi:hypothetical protein